MAEEFEPVTTQEQLDKIVNAKLKENTNAVTKQFEGYVSLLIWQKRSRAMKPL